MTNPIRRLGAGVLRIVFSLLAPTAIAAVALVETASQGERFAAAFAVCTVSAMWAAAEYAKAEAKADKEMAAFAIDVLRRLTSGESTELNVTVSHHTVTVSRPAPEA